MPESQSWLVWALLSAGFAAATAILAKIGLEGIGLATGASWVCYFRALKLGEAYRVAPIDKLSVVLMAIFAVAFLGERPAPRDWVGIACVGVGVLLLSLKNGKTCAPPASSGKEVAKYFICGVISRSDLRSEGR